MMLSKIAFVLCLLFLLCTWAAGLTATRKGDKRRLHSLHLVTLGLSLSACAYLFHIESKSPSVPFSLLSLVFRIGGIAFLWLAWHEHWAQQRERRAAHGQERDESLEFRLALPPDYQEVYSSLNSRAQEAMCAAQEEALRQRCCCVDTDHLLLGLLHVPHCTASCILERSEIRTERLAWELSRQAGTVERIGTVEQADRASAEVPAAFTPRARQVLAMAEIEARRFGKTFVGTEHLLLGLLLTGTGPAASALFSSGMTVDGIRREVMASKRPN